MSSRRGGRVLAVLVFAAIFGFRSLSYTGFTNDHFVHLARAQQMLLGAWPVRDFVDPGMPLMYALSAGGLLLFGHNLVGDAVIVFGALAAAGVLTLVLTRAVTGSTIAALGAVVLQVLAYPRSYSYPKLLIYAIAIAACWSYLAKPSTWRLLALGLCTSAAFLLRHDHGLFVGAASILTVALAESGVQARLRRAAVFLVVTLVMLAPWALLIASSGGVRAYGRSAIEFSRTEGALTRVTMPAFEIRPADGLWVRGTAASAERPTIHIRWAPDLSDAQRAARERDLGLELVQRHEGRTWLYRVDPDPAQRRAILADAAVEDTDGLERMQLSWSERLLQLLGPLRGGPGRGLPIGTNSVALLYYACLFTVAAGLVMLLMRAGAASTPGSAARLAVVTLLAVCVTATFLRDPLAERIADVAMPLTLLGSWSIVVVWRNLQHASAVARAFGRTAVAVLVSLIMASVTVIGHTGDQLERIGSLRPAELRDRAAAIGRALAAGDPSAFAPSATSVALTPVYRFLQACTAPTDRFVYVGFAPEAYFFADRGFGGGQAVVLSDYYASDDEQRLTRSRLERERVPVVVMPEQNADDYRTLFPIVSAYVDANYSAFDTIQLPDDRRAAIMIDRRLTPTETFGESGWPCFR